MARAYSNGTASGILWCPQINLSFSRSTYAGYFFTLKCTKKSLALPLKDLIEKDIILITSENYVKFTSKIAYVGYRVGVVIVATS